MSRNTAYWNLFGIIVLAALARFYRLTSRSIWFDESFTWRLINFPAAEIIARTGADVHPPLYYLLLNAWTVVFGSGLFSLRSFSIVIILLLIALTFHFVSRFANSPSAGLIAALFISLSGWHILLSQEARMYTLGALLALVSTYLIWLATTTKPPKIWPWIAYALTAAALIYTHYYGLFTLVAHAIWFVGYIIHQTRGRIGEIFQLRVFWLGLLSAIIAIALFLPWLPTLQAQRAQVSDSFWIPGVTGWSMPDTIYRMFIGTAGPIEHWTISGFIIALLPSLLLLIITIWLLISPVYKKSSIWLVILAGFSPFVVSIVISLISNPIYQDRYMIFGYTFLAIIIALWLNQLKPKNLRLALTSITVVLFAIATWHFHIIELNLNSKLGIQSAINTIYANKSESEPVYITSSFIYFSARHYAEEKFADTKTKLYSPSGSTDFAHFAGGPIILEKDVVSKTNLDNQDSLWLIDTTGFGGSETEMEPHWSQQEKLVFSEVFDYQGDIIVRHFVR